MVSESGFDAQLGKRPRSCLAVCPRALDQTTAQQGHDRTAMAMAMVRRSETVAIFEESRERGYRPS